jgi:hypothetical protein
MQWSDARERRLITQTRVRMICSGRKSAELSRKRNTAAEPIHSQKARCQKSAFFNTRSIW